MIPVNKMLNEMLDHNCGTPVDMEAYEKWRKEHDPKLLAYLSQTRSEEEGVEIEKPQSYSGWMTFQFTAHCVLFTLVAKRAKNGGWIIKSYIAEDH